MYKEHPIFEKPENENVKIWRYLDFTKFVSLLDRRALFFARADKLGDPFEGSSSKVNVELRRKVYKDIPHLESVLKEIQDVAKDIVKCIVINCWNINEYESAAMWNLYLKSDEGVAIQSTFKRLIESFDKTLEKNVHVGKVKYIDYNTEWIPEDYILYPFLHKRKSFEHERELRAIIFKLPVKGDMIDFSQEVFVNGTYIPVNLDILIEKIYVSPTSPDWFFELTRSVTNKYGLEKDVKRSSLAEDPVY